VIIPVQCQFLGYEATKRTISFISQIKAFNNPRIRLSRVVPVMYDSRNKLSHIIFDQLEHSFNGTLTNSIIRVNTSLAEAPAYGKTIFDYKPLSHGAEDFLQLAREIMAQYENVPCPDSTPALSSPGNDLP
jgi:chromosome partitioning protein